MINLLLGPPGAGKSYEATVYHILPALARGRKVITNLPLNIEALSAIDATYAGLIEIRSATLAPEPKPPTIIAGRSDSAYVRTVEFSNRAFANPQDYLDEWRHPEGFGPLYVIDECHFCLPAGRTQRGVEEWYSMHRHYNVDVLLITQSFGKISRPIVDLVQVCYKVRKAVALGQNDSYIRKVLDGVKGAVVSEDVRKYKPQMFGLWRSHTHGVPALEQSASDVSSIVSRFKKIRNWFFLVVFVAVIYAFWPTEKQPKAKPVAKSSDLVQASLPAKSSQAESVVLPGQAQQPETQPEPETEPEPFTGKLLHLTGVFTMHGKTLHTFAISSQNRRIGNTDSKELQLAGYVFAAVTPCIGNLTWKGKTRPVTCDAPDFPQATNDRPVVVTEDPQGKRLASTADRPEGPILGIDRSTPGQINQAELVHQYRQKYGEPSAGLRF